jgi:hypothetical protein
VHTSRWWYVTGAGPKPFSPAPLKRRRVGDFCEQGKQKSGTKHAAFERFEPDLWSPSAHRRLFQHAESFSIQD